MDSESNFSSGKSNLIKLLPFLLIGFFIVAIFVGSNNISNKTTLNSSAAQINAPCNENPDQISGYPCPTLIPTTNPDIPIVYIDYNKLTDRTRNWIHFEPTTPDTGGITSGTDKSLVPGLLNIHFNVRYLNQPTNNHSPSVRIDSFTMDSQSITFNPSALTPPQETDYHDHDCPGSNSTTTAQAEVTWADNQPETIIWANLPCRGPATTGHLDIQDDRTNDIKILNNNQTQVTETLINYVNNTDPTLNYRDDTQRTIDPARFYEQSVGCVRTLIAPTQPSNSVQVSIAGFQNPITENNFPCGETEHLIAPAVSPVPQPTSATDVVVPVHYTQANYPNVNTWVGIALVGSRPGDDVPYDYPGNPVILLNGTHDVHISCPHSAMRAVFYLKYRLPNNQISAEKDLVDDQGNTVLDCGTHAQTMNVNDSFFNPTIPTLTPIPPPSPTFTPAPVPQVKARAYLSTNANPNYYSFVFLDSITLTDISAATIIYQHTFSPAQLLPWGQYGYQSDDFNCVHGHLYSTTATGHGPYNYSGNATLLSNIFCPTSGADIAAAGFNPPSPTDTPTPRPSTAPQCPSDPSRCFNPGATCDGSRNGNCGRLGGTCEPNNACTGGFECCGNFSPQQPVSGGDTSTNTSATTGSTQSTSLLDTIINFIKSLF